MLFKVKAVVHELSLRNKETVDLKLRPHCLYGQLGFLEGDRPTWLQILRMVFEKFAGRTFIWAATRDSFNGTYKLDSCL